MVSLQETQEKITIEICLDIRYSKNEFYKIYKDKRMKELFTYLLKMDWKKLFIEPTDNTILQFFRYVFVGGVAFVVDGGSLFLIELMGVHYLVATAFAFILGLVANFVLSKLLVFQGNESNRSNGIEFFVYGIIGVIGLGITEGIMYVCTEELKLYFMLSKIIAAAIVLVWNFAARKIVLYRG